LILSAAGLPAILWPAYARPAELTDDQLAAQPGRSTDVRFGGVARLIRIDVPRGDWPKPGDEPAVSLCWQALAADPRRLMVLLQFVGPENRVVATRRTLPGLGAFPTALWRPGDRFCDRVHLPLPEVTPAPAVYQVEVAMIDPGANTRLAAFAPDGTPLGATFVDRIKIAPDTYAAVAVEHEFHAGFADQIELIGYALGAEAAQAGGAIDLRLYWRALRRPDADYTVFVHLRDATGQTIAQADGQPQRGAYPTSFWDAGESVSDEHPIDVPTDAAPGGYTIAVGLYELPSGDRLPIAGDDARTEVNLPARVRVR
jgi:hypothetical protein